MIELAPCVSNAELAEQSDLIHVVCHCNIDMSLCGRDVSDQPWVPDDTETSCVVCDDLDLSPCSNCGAV